MMKVVPATPDLVERIKLQPDQCRQDNRSEWIGHPNVPSLLHQWGIVALDGEEPFAAGLILPWREGLAEALAWIGEVCLTSFPHQRVLYTSAKALIDEAQRKGFFRIEARAEATHARAISWLEHLGFAYEGTLRQYGPGREDYYLYARCA